MAPEVIDKVDMAVAGTIPEVEPKSAPVGDVAEVKGGGKNDRPDENQKDEGEAVKEQESKPFDEEFGSLVRSVCDFTKHLEPWRVLMPPDLSIQYSDLQKFSKELSEEKGFVDKPEPWLCKVERYWMKTYKEPVPATRRPPVPIIEAFYKQDSQTRNNEQTLSGNDSKPQQGSQRSVEASIPAARRPQRIQINSDILRDELQSITSVTCPEIPLIIPPPYKLLVRYFRDMQKRLQELEEELQKAENPSSIDDKEVVTEDKENSVDNDFDGLAHSMFDASLAVSDKRIGTAEESKEDQIKKLRTRLDHLRCLYNLVDTELKDLIELRAEIAAATLKQIAFEDLWHLFEPGDLIFGRDIGREQLYRVYAVTGGAVKLRNYTYSEMSSLQYARDRRTGYRNKAVSSDEEDSDKPLREDAAGHGSWTALKVDCFTMAYDGTRFGPKEACKKIKHYLGKREITKLRMFPIRFHPDKERIVQDMLARGTKFLRLSVAGHRSYEGMSVALKRSVAREEVDSDIYVDFDAYYQKKPTTKPAISKLLRSLVDVTETSERFPGPGGPLVHETRTLSGKEVDERLAEEYMAPNRTFLEPLEQSELSKMPDLIQLLPHYVVAYAFRSRQWYFLDIDQIRNIGEESHMAQGSGFEELVISKRYRDLLVALVDNHASGLQRKANKLRSKTAGTLPVQLDLVRGKGQGLIILLHGPPGSGKTSTAETIAAYTRRPLYSITCGDLGLTPDIVESRLMEHTKLADKWGCVLLLDEADVFLMQRAWRDLERNALVSVFLRQLEYYSGILFLTTNRPGVIDEAFKSRIHISLRYPAIDLESTKTMWNNILNRLERDNKTADIRVLFDREVLLDFAEKHYSKHEPEGTAWNGRQIRNAFQTALALAHYERLGRLRENGMTAEEAASSGKRKWMSVKLTKAIFQNIAKTAREFELYIGMLRGRDSERVRDEELRDDYNDPTAQPASKQYLSIRGGGHGRSASSSSTAKAPKSKTPKRNVVENDSEQEEDFGDDDEDLEEEDDNEDDGDV